MVTLFVRRIPTHSSKKDLREFVERSIPWFWRMRIGKGVHVVKTNVLTITDAYTRSMECHGLITIEPDAIADKLIARLNLKHFNGKRVLVRRYYIRDPKNDRRRDNRTRNLEGNHRLRDRRRDRIEIIDEDSLHSIAQFKSRLLI